MGCTRLFALATIVALAFLQTTVGVAYAKGPIHSAEHDFSQFTVAVFLPMIAVAALAIAIAFRSAGYQQEIAATDHAAVAERASGSLAILGTILLAGGLLLLAFSGIYSEYGQMMFFYNHYWNCMECGSFTAIMGIISTVGGLFLIATNHRYLSYCIRRLHSLYYVVRNFRWQ
jgi:hypothetical protein